MNPLPELTARLRETWLNIAVRVDDHADLRMCARLWSHAGPRAAWVMLGAVPMAPFVYRRAAPLVLLAVLVLLVFAGSRLADSAHETGWTDRAHPCPLCPAHPGNDDDHGNGGGSWNGDFPAAPPPMNDYDDDRIRAMAGNLDAQYFALVQEVSP